MNAILISCAILLLITWIQQGFNLVSIMCTFTTLLFCSRKVGHFCKFNTLVVTECLTIFLVTVIQMLFKKFVLIKLVILLIIRLIFFGICLYDMTMFVYVKEKRRKGEEE